ncbi:MAG: 4Fe-4S cluster-binding domain-containing protein [Desulfobulbaceae bacterium]|nr:4Fe-4S cluster-binding domain-containing protein [Desulfobulbaceae bacterium]
MLTGIHFILTYTCNFECDHCFLYCSPRSQGTFTISQVAEVLDEAKKTGSVEWIYFEGGEPFLFFPLLVECIRQARGMDFKVGVVTNAYGAFTEEDAALWLKPLAEAGLSYMNISNDSLHYGDQEATPASIAIRVAERLGIETAPICIDKPKVEEQHAEGGTKGRPVIGGNVKFRGRAVEKLTGNLPLRLKEQLTQCPYEDLVSPSRVHVDAFGNVHLCQGISMGNWRQTSLSELVKNYEAQKHPICGPLVRGGPMRLCEEYGLDMKDEYVDECHLCYAARLALLDQIPAYLAPRQVYGLL